MSYSGGVFSINTTGQPVVSGTTISASVFNALTADLATGLSTCMLKDGTQTATAGIGFYAGTVSLPGIYFGTETSTGLYRIGANNTGYAVSGAKVLDIASTGFAVTGTLSSTGTFNVNGSKFGVTASTGDIGADGILALGSGAVLNGKITSTFDGISKNGIVLNDTTSSNGLGFSIFALSGTAIGSITRNASTSAVLYNTTSDYRVKDIYGPIDIASAVKAFRNLKVYDGKFKGSEFNQPLMLAHEVKEITPWAVTGEKDEVDSEGNPKLQQMATGTHESLLIAVVQNCLDRLDKLGA